MDKEARGESPRNAINKRTWLKFYPSPHSLKNSTVCSLGTGAGRVFSPGGVSRKTPHNQSGAKRTQPHTLGSGTPPTRSANLQHRGPRTSSAPPPFYGAASQDTRVAPGAHARTRQPLRAAQGLPGRASQSAGRRGTASLRPLDHSRSLPAKQNRE